MTIATLYTPDDGIKIYSTLGLKVYDALIMGAVTRYVWNCPSNVFVAYYRSHVSGNHADVGVGTGFVLDRCGLAPGDTRLALIDLQQNCLDYAANRLARFSPERYVWDASEANRRSLSGIQPFDSIGLGGILHCLPGDMRQKARVFDALRVVCNDRATIFGYSLVNDAIRHRLRRRLVHRLFQQLQVVNFADDSACALERELAQRYEHYELEVIGCFAFFRATVVRSLNK
jgi:hypothetical protein